MFRCCLVAWVLISLVPAKAAGACLLKGQVVFAHSGEPAHRVALRLSAVNDDKRAYSVQSDSAGRFAFQNVTAGSYYLFGERQGYCSRQAYGSRRNPLRGAVIYLVDGQDTGDLVFKMVPDGSISGQVLDEEGIPTPAEVFVLKYAYRDGRRELHNVGIRGNVAPSGFAIDGIPPGRYILAAAPPARIAAASSGAGSPGEQASSYLPTFYPGSTDIADATLVDIAMGSHTTFTLQLVRRRTARVRGRVIAPIQGLLGFVLLRENADGAIVPVSDRIRVSLNSAKEFDISGLTAGSYIVATTGTPSLFGRLKVGAMDINGVEIQLLAAGEALGSVTPAANKNLKIVLEPIDVRLPASVIGVQNGDGQFTMKDVFPIRYRVKVDGIPADQYLKSIRLGDRDSNGEVDFRSGVAGRLAITLGGPASRITGLVRSGQGSTGAGALVSLVPLSAQFADYRTVDADENGAFQFDGLPPGRYRLLAWEDLDLDADRDTEVLRRFLDRASLISVGENDTKNVQLTAISPYLPLDTEEAK